MIQSLIKAVAKGLLIIFAVAVINFILLRLAPADPVVVMAGQLGDADEQLLADLRREYGLDKSIFTQLVTYIFQLAKLNFGNSFLESRPVADMILERVLPTLSLSIAALVFAVVLGVLIGTLSAVNQGKFLDRFFSVFSLIFYAMPMFLVGIVLVLIFSVWLQWLPSFGRTTIGSTATGIGAVLDIARHMILPSVTLGLFYLALYSRMTRASMLEVLGMDFVRTARSKGASETRIIFYHALKNAILPVVTLVGMQIGQLLSGAVIIEAIFGWPGLGLMTFNAVLQRDYNVILGVFFITAVLVVIVNIITEIVYGLIDPRMRTAS